MPERALRPENAPDVSPGRPAPALPRRVVVVRRAAGRLDLWRWYGEGISFRLGFLLPPVFMLLPVIVWSFLHPDWASIVEMLTLVGTTVLALDAAIVAGYVAFHYEWWLIVLVLLWVELWLLLWIVRNLEFLRRWRRLDRFITRRETRAVEVYKKYRFVRRFHFWGVALFTFLPLNSGVFMGVFVGKVTGMPTRALLFAVYFGVTTWILLVMWAVALSVEFLRPYIPDF